VTYYAETRNPTTNAVSPQRTPVKAYPYTEDLSTITTVADNDETSAATAPAEWAGEVVRHKAKQGVYEEFYSAEFGPAGRWMTTNLSAWAYDTNIPPGQATLPANPDAGDSNTDPHWCYPGLDGGDGTNPDAYNANPHMGLLYNWPAATGKQNTSTVDQCQVSGPTPGQYEVETVAQNGRYQGICPNGWHLPSDREWNELEKEIYNRPELYSSYSASDLPFKSQYDKDVAEGEGEAQSGWRDKWESGTTWNDPPGTIGGIGYRGATQNRPSSP
jgi:uncharacterized protein (TIGR02145 family)